MSLYGKNLRFGVRGDDVVELHGLLERAGHPPPPDEAHARSFDLGTQSAVREFQLRHGLRDSGVVDDETVAALQGDRPPDQPADQRPEPDASRPVVRGQVMYRRGLSISGVHVVALHRRLRDEVVLGSGVTDERGEFVIEYDPADVGGGQVDLQVRAFAGEEEARRGTVEFSIAQSRIFYAARPLEKVRIRVNGGPETRWTEYQQTVAELDAHLDGLPIADLDEKPGTHDLSLLAGKTNQPLKRLADLVVAHRLAAKTGIAPETMYGLVRRGMATDLGLLASQADGRLQAALQSASDRGLVPVDATEDVAAVATGIRTAAVGELADSPDLMGGMLHSLDDADARRNYVKTLIEFDAVWAGPGAGAAVDVEAEDRDEPGLWDLVARDPQLVEKVPTLQLNMQLAALTGEHSPLVTVLSDRLDGDGGGVKALASYSLEDFTTLLTELPEGQRVPADFASAIKASLPADTPADQLETAQLTAYASALHEVVAGAMPTEVLANTFVNDDSTPEDAKTFWRNVLRDDTTFDLRAGLDPTALDDGLFDGVPDQATLIEEVATVKRMFNITKDPVHMKVLRGAGLDSAQAIARLGASTFIGRYAEDLGGPTQALDYASKAISISAASAAIYSTFSPDLNDTPMYVLPAYNYEGKANLETLFGSTSYCDCDDCKSILSPAAYLAELLGWLGDRRLPGGGTALDELYRRRPDIGEIELSCVNTNTALPYLDLAIELLENLISPIPDLVLDAASAADLDAQDIPDAVRDAFSAAGFALTADHLCYVVTPAEHWFVTDHRVLWVLRRTSATELTARFGSYQTAAAAAALAAEPEHRNPKAYDALRAAPFPIAAPLDLWTEDVRTYIGHLLDDPDAPATHRRDLMLALATAAQDPYTDLDMACESLGITVGQRKLITGRSADPWLDFGLVENDNEVTVFDTALEALVPAALGWVAALRWMPQALHRFDVDYADLLELLDADFVDPDGLIRIESADPKDPATCDIAKLVLTNFGAAEADRLRRFVRLRRTLGWSTRECDDLITALRSDVGDVNDRIDDALLVALSCVDRLHKRLGITLAELPALWATLRADRPDDLYPQLFGNPAVIRPADPAFTLTTAGGAPEVALLADDPPNAIIGAHASPIMSALNLTAAEVDALATKLTDGTLSIANLSTLYRYSRLAHSLQMPIDELLVLRECADQIFPAGATGPVATERFVDLVTELRESGLTVPEADYLLFHQITGADQPDPLSEQDIATSLGEVRNTLRDVAASTDLAGAVPVEALRRWMAQLRWPTAVVDDVVAVLDDSATFAAPLAPVPAGLIIPDALMGRVAVADGRLRVRGTLTTAQRDALLAASADAGYHNAVNAVYDAPRAALSRYLKVWQWPPLSAPLAALPATIQIPPELRTRLYFDPSTQRLVVNEPLAEQERTRLVALSADAAWVAAIGALDAAADAYAPTATERLFTAPEVTALLDTDASARIITVAGGFAGHLRIQLSQRAVVTAFAEQLGLPLALVDEMLTRRLTSLVAAGQPAITDFLDAAFASGHPDVALTTVGFERQFLSYRRLFKLGKLVERLRWSSAELGWLADYASTVADRPVPWQPALNAPWWLPDSLPVTATARSAERLAALLRVVRLGRSAAKLGGPVVDMLLSLARQAGTTLADLTKVLAAATSRNGVQINATDLTALATVRGLAVADFADETGMWAQLPAIELIRCTGASAAQLLEFAAPECDDHAARSAREVVKARYDDAQWRAVAGPLRDVLRGAQRDALLNYVLADPNSRWPALQAESELYRHLLLDSRTEPMVGTSRIKQALSSVQLFVQSATMNLITGVEVDAATDPGWRDWLWMKNYRVWEANRKVFCFPENWMEPSLRDDKTPLFTELESALLRDDVTADVAHDAFETYLGRLDEIARLEILGIYEVDATAGAPATLYAVGRSRGLTPKYFWRTRIDNAEWTPWQTVDVDISEPQVLPVVWNGRLHVFWPIFADVTPQQTPGDKPTLPGNRHYDITLGYSYFHRGKWQPKQITEVSVSTPLVPVSDRPETVKNQLVLRALVGSPELWIWPEYDNPDVNISTVKPGYTPTNPGENSVYKSVQGFHFTGRSRQVETYGQDIAGVFEPTGTVPVGMLFAQKGNNRLNLPATLDWRTEAMALGRVPSAFTLAYPHQDRFISGARSFVYQDGQRCFVVDPSTGVDLDWNFVKKDKITPAVVGKVKASYYAQVTGYATQVAAPAEFAVAIDPVTTHGTSDPLQLAKAAATREVVAKPARRVLRRNAFQVGDQREFISKADKSILKISDYVSNDRIVKDLGPILVAKQVRRYLFRTAFHPYVGDFQQDLAAGGVDRMITREGQSRSVAPFQAAYKPETLVEEPYPIEDVDFEPAGFFQQYNWELFFHAPVLMATKLSANQRFEDAQRWFHLVFDPTDTSKQQVPARFWRTKPLFDASKQGVLPQRLSDIINALAAGTADAGLLRQVAKWRANPFNPYAIGRMRLVAFQKMVVMAYLDNLIAWGDQLFRQDTIESINYAANLYMLAGDILGERPPAIPQRARPEIRTAVSLDPQLEMLSNSLVTIEHRIGSTAPDSVVIDPDAPPLAWPKMEYFGIPKNDKLFGYWDTVADRLYKIRNSMNIEGVSRQLPLFEPPIDPALLVRARAAGLDISAVLSEVSAPPPTYRFRTLAGQALDLANDVRNLGAALLAALEKRDAEALAMLRAKNENELALAIEDIKENQESEARKQIDVLRSQRATAVSRYQHYQRLLGVTTVTEPPEDVPITPVAASSNAQIPSSEGVKLLSHDKAELGSLEESRDSQTLGAVAQGAGSVLSVLPTFSFSAKPWGIGVGSSWGGGNLAAAANAVGSVFNANASSSSFDASKAGRLAQAVVREHDWVLQTNQAAAEIMSVDRQRLAAELRLDVATKDLENHRTTMRQSAEVQEFLSTKYTNTELYDWMASQVSAMYFQSYQLAYDTAKRAERAMQRELCVNATQYIQFGYWDSTRKGLLAGERLHTAIARMQTEYLHLNRRTYEITKHVSLANVNPAALLELRETGTCTVQIPEALFDLDRPGDYCRRVKMVSLSLPCVTGPYTGINCTMTLLSSQIRTSATPAKPYRSTGPDDARFTFVSPVESMVTSSGRDDSGMFQPDMRDERFLPFEGAGAAGTWRLELPSKFRQFDYTTISDAVITIRYTALNGGQSLRDAALADLHDALLAMEVGEGRNGLYRLMSGKHDFADSWYRMMHPQTDEPTLSTFTYAVDPQRLPIAFHAAALAIDRVAVVLRCGKYDTDQDFTVKVTRPGGPAEEKPVRIMPTELGGLPVAVFEFGGAGVKVDAEKQWTIEFTALPDALRQEVQIGADTVTRLKLDALDDLGLLLGYRF